MNPQPEVPILGKVIFVDWHGVLSRDPFWTSILTTRHPLRTIVSEKLGEVFDRDAPTSHEWMKGLRSSEQIIAGMDVPLPSRYKPDFLRRRLDEDCRRMAVNVDLFQYLRLCRSHAHVVVATDNMDCFADAFTGIRRGRARWNKAARTLSQWAMICDDIICSSDVRALKCDDPQRFFRPYLDGAGLTFADATLIDDRADNCEAFRTQGGHAIQWQMQKNSLDELRTVLNPWLSGTQAQTVSAPGR